MPRPEDYYYKGRRFEDLTDKEKEDFENLFAQQKEISEDKNRTLVVPGPGRSYSFYDLGLDMTLPGLINDEYVHIGGSSYRSKVKLPKNL